MSRKPVTDTRRKPAPPAATVAPSTPAIVEAAPTPKAAKQLIPNIDGQKRIIIEGVTPQVDGGRFPIKRTVGDIVVVEADAFTDGHDALHCVLQYRRAGDAAWQEVLMTALGNDRWRGQFAITEAGRYEYCILAWVDHFKSWQHDLGRWEQLEDIALSLRIGAELVEKAAHRSSGLEQRWLAECAVELVGERDLQQRRELGLDEELAQRMFAAADRTHAASYPQTLGVIADDVRARFSTWYEMFPRSCSTVPGQHGTFKDCEAWLPRIAEMGFDVLYFPPIHPVGRVNRKGKNNTLTPDAQDVGSPWAIGSSEGGHKSILPALGTLEDFHNLVRKAKEYGIDIALDIALQCAPDHPYVKEHPDWFRWRPDGTVQYAENPPKKYQDIYPFNFETADWQALWVEIKSIFEYWIEQGVRIFRVDNPHTKPFAMWEWLIAEVKQKTPDAIFLAEAFTRPKVMHRLAKLGYTQSYTYYAWRNTKWELTEYLMEVCQGPGRQYFRPNFWPNTPDILTEALQFGGKPMFQARLAMAATMTANYGIYGPAYEMMEHVAVRPGSEEYLDSEKYQLRQRSFDELNGENSLHDFITQINRIRRDNPALQHDWGLQVHSTDNEQLLCYSKSTPNHSNVVLVIVNLDPNHTQAGWTGLNLEALGLDIFHPFQVHDLLSGAQYIWNGPRNYVELNPLKMPAHIFQIRNAPHTERDFLTFGG